MHTHNQRVWEKASAHNKGGTQAQNKNTAAGFRPIPRKPHGASPHTYDTNSNNSTQHNHSKASGLPRASRGHGASSLTYRRQYSSHSFVCVTQRLNRTPSISETAAAAAGWWWWWEKHRDRKRNTQPSICTAGSHRCSTVAVCLPRKTGRGIP